MPTYEIVLICPLKSSEPIKRYTALAFDVAINYAQSFYKDFAYLWEFDNRTRIEIRDFNEYNKPF